MGDYIELYIKCILARGKIKSIKVVAPSYT